MNYIKRNLEKVVSQVTKEYPVVLVTGPRQVGKTTMLQKLMEGTNRGYVTLDDLNERAIAKTDPELFIQLHKPPVLIDEVQYAPELFAYIKMNVDKNHEPGAFWLTGSQVFKLMRGVQESLAGRMAVLSLTSLSQAEISCGEMEPFTIEMEALAARCGQMVNVAEIRKTYLNCGKEPYMYYYRDKDAKEIDIVLEHDGVLNPIEIKKTSNPGTELIKVFDLLDKSSTPRSKGAVVCMKPGLGAIDRDNYIVPIWMI